MTNREAFFKRHGIDTKDSLSLDDISRLSGMPVRVLKKVYSRGMGAYRTNPESVRPQVTSPQQWAYGRVYSFVMKQKGTYYGQDADLVKEI
jgi:hypothetical protein